MQAEKRENAVKWIKKGLVYCPSGRFGFDVTHCHKPTPLIVDENTLRVYFGARNEHNKTRTTYVDLNSHNLNEVLYVHDRPVLDLGAIGAFDDSGVNVSSIVRVGSLVYMYYIGINTSTTVHMQNAIGLAVSRDNGRTFTRLFEGAVIDRSKDEPYYIGAAEVIRVDEYWRAYYTCGSEWKIIGDRPEIFYHIKYGESRDGINWERAGHFCIPPQHEYEVTARPCVVKADGTYRMWYSRWSLDGFRTDSAKSYRIGYAESTDGKTWVRLDEKAGLDVSSEGWDSEMIAYPYVLKLNGRWIMLYNGNQFGKTGFGYAELQA
jgi:predicted GH43/DUF377 family glycosyl hydrolase